MKERRYYKVQHMGELMPGEPYWFEANPHYYGIERANYFSDKGDAVKMMDAIVAKGIHPAEEYRIVYCVETEEVVA